MSLPTGKARPLPGRPGACRVCGARVVAAITVAGPNGRGGKWQMFDPVEHPDGRVAVRPTGGHLPVARALSAGDALDETIEYRAMPHAATCRPPVTPKVPAGVADLATYRTRKATR